MSDVVVPQLASILQNFDSFFSTLVLLCVSAGLVWGLAAHIQLSFEPPDRRTRWAEAFLGRV